MEIDSEATTEILEDDPIYAPKTVKRFQYTLNCPYTYADANENEWIATYDGWISNILEKDKGSLIQFWVYQYERAPSNGRLHVQGFIRLKQPRKFAFVKKLVGLDTDRAHIEAAFASDQENLEYCTKESDRVPHSEPFIFGEPSTRGQGTRTDLVIATEMIKEGRHLSEVAQEQPSTIVRYHRGLLQLQSLLLPVQRSLHWPGMPSTSGTSVVADRRWYFGDPGTGKTVDVYREFGPSAVYAKSTTNVWFDGFDPRQHKCILVDDYRLSPNFNYAYLLAFLDIYPYQAEIKGGHVSIGNQVIIITCNFSFDTIFQDERPRTGNYANDTPLARRLTCVREFRHNGSASNSIGDT